MTPNNKTMVARDLHLFSKLIELVTSKICSLVPKTHSLHPCPQTIVENKAYNLLSGVIKLKTPKIGSVAHQKNNHLWEVDFSKYERSLSYWDLKIFFPKCYKNIFSIVLAWPYREGKINFPALSGGGTDDENVTSTQELKKDKDHLPIPSLPLTIKM